MTQEAEHLTGIVGILADPMVWYATAVALFFIFIFFAARKPILAVLDAEIAKVRDELEQAKKLRAEAAATLADYAKRQKQAMEEAESIVRQAKADAEQLRKQTDEDLKEALKHHEEKALLRIRMAEEEALIEVRAAVVDQAVAAARSALASQLDPAKAASLADQAIADAPKLMASRK